MTAGSSSRSSDEVDGEHAVVVEGLPDAERDRAVLCAYGGEALPGALIVTQFGGDPGRTRQVHLDEDVGLVEASQTMPAVAMRRSRARAPRPATGVRKASGSLSIGDLAGGQRPNFRASFAATTWRHERRDVAAHRGDLADKRGGDVARAGAAGRKTVLDVRRHRAVHPGHLHLVVEVGGVAEPADDDPRARLPRRIDHQPVEGRRPGPGPPLPAAPLPPRRSLPSAPRAGTSASSTGGRRSPPPPRRRRRAPPRGCRDGRW